MNGVYAFRDRSRPKPFTGCPLALIIVAGAALVHGRGVENLVVAQRVENEAGALGPPVAGGTVGCRR